MAKHYLAIAYLLIGALLGGLGATAAMQWVHSDEPPASYHESAADVLKRNPALSPSQAARMASEVRPCATPGGFDGSSLCTQWRSALAAEQSSLWTFWQMVLSFLGVIGLGATLWFNMEAWKSAKGAQRDTDEALKHARKSAEAAERQADVAEDTAKRSLRAYLSYDFTNATRHRKDDRLSWDNLHFAIKWKNVGKTPAYKNRSFVGVAIVSPGTVPTYPRLNEPSDGGVVVGGGGSTIVLATPSISKEQVARIARNEIHCFVVARVGYRDVFGDNWVEDCCIQVMFGPQAATDAPDILMDGTVVYSFRGNVKEDDGSGLWHFVKPDLGVMQP